MLNEGNAPNPLFLSLLLSLSFPAMLLCALSSYQLPRPGPILTFPTGLAEVLPRHTGPLYLYMRALSCLSSVSRQMPQFQKGQGPTSPIMKAFSQIDSPKQSQHFWVQLPESHPTKMLPIEDKLPDEVIFHQQQQDLV
jgi:hypothetical protein